MNRVLVTETLEQIEQSQVQINSNDREFIVWYALNTGDKELAAKLIDELAVNGADKEAVMQKYRQLCDKREGWVEQLEKLLVSLEIYRAVQEKVIGHITEFLTAYGISISTDKTKEAESPQLKDMAEKANVL